MYQPVKYKLVRNKNHSYQIISFIVLRAIGQTQTHIILLKEQSIYVNNNTMTMSCVNGMNELSNETITIYTNVITSTHMTIKRINYSKK